MPDRRVLIVGGSPMMSGGEISLLRAVGHLPALGWEVRTALVVPAAGATGAALASVGLPPAVFTVERVRSAIAGATAVRGLARLARDVDVIHANDIRAAFYCQAAALLARKPWTFHARDLYNDGSHFERSLRFVRPTRVAAVSQPVAARVTSIFHWSRSHIDIVHSGIDAAAYRASANAGAWRAEFGLEADTPVVGTVGRLVAGKGHDDFIRAAARVARSRPDVRFFIVGGELVDGGVTWGLGAEAARLRSLATSLGVGEAVVLTGPRDDVASAMAAFDVAVVASSAEPFGLVALEAMAQGTAVVGTAAGGIPEIIIDGESGVLVPARSPDELAAAIEALLADPARRFRLGGAGQARVAAVFPPGTEAAGLAGCWARAVGA